MTRAQTKDPEAAVVEVVPVEVEVAPELPPPTNVIAAIARVMAEIGGIEKLTPQQRKARGMSGGDAEGIKYAYRGIDQLAQHAQPLFGKYGVVIVPNVADVDIDKIVKGGATMENTTWTRTTVTVEWTLFGPGVGQTNPQFDSISTTVHGVGDDNSDKGYNKAMTASFKNLLLRILCIGDPQDDPDGRDENQPMPYVDPAPEKSLGDQVFEMMKNADPKVRVLIRQFAADNDKPITGKALNEDPEWAEKLKGAIERYVETLAQDADAEQPQVPPEGGDEPPAEPGSSDAGEVPPPAADPGKVKLGGAAKRGAQSKVDETTNEAAAAVEGAFPGTTEVTE